MEKQDFLMEVSNAIHKGIAEYFPNETVLLFQIMAKVVFVLAIFLVSLLFFGFIIDIILRKVFNKKDKYPFIFSLYQVKANRTAIVLLAFTICQAGIDSIFQAYHPITNKIVTRLVDFLVVIYSARLAYKTLKAVEYHYQLKNDHYRVIALKAVSQILRVVGSVIFTFIGISILFGIKGATIFGYVSAFTAVFFLIFRDFILGFITGLHVATQRTYKVGDWVRIDKYDLDGTIMDISTLTTKVKNFDHTISTIPTYDLLNTEVKNFEVMRVGNKRRIKKSITFNINSFKFVDDELFAKFEKISLISDYLKEISQEISHNNEQSINQRRLTNIGVFRRYVEEYLKNNPKIDKTDTILARQLDITPQGLPLEIYCFTIYPDLLDYEKVQADIFDHLLVASKTFDLEVSQLIKA